MSGATNVLPAPVMTVSVFFVDAAPAALTAIDGDEGREGSRPLRCE